jgi:hypothetical protein
MLDLDKDLEQILEYIEEEEPNPDLPYFACESLPYWLGEVKRLRARVGMLEGALDVALRAMTNEWYGKPRRGMEEAYNTVCKALRGE